MVATKDGLLVCKNNNFTVVLYHIIVLFKQVIYWALN